MSTPPIDTPRQGGDSPVEVAGGFPRHLTQELLDENTRGRERLNWLAPWCLGAAYALFALAFPLERVIGNFPMKAAADEGLWWMLLKELGGESYGFLLAAISAGFFLPLMAHALTATGIPRGPSLAAASCVGLSPLLIHSATLPGPEAASGLLCLLAFWIAAPHGVSSARTSTAIAFGLGAALLDPGGLLIVPALLMRHFSLSTRHLPSGRSTWYGFAWGIAFVVAMQLLQSFIFLEAPLSEDTPIIRFAIFPGAVGLGVGLLATSGLFLKRPGELAEDTPDWLRLWLIGGLATLFFPGASGICLAPVAAFSIADFLARGTVKPFAASFLILSAQLTLSLGALRHVRVNDPHASWRLLFQATAREGDRLVSSDPAHRYLAEVRWGFSAFEPEDPLGTLSTPYLLDLKEHPPFLKRMDGADSE